MSRFAVGNILRRRTTSNVPPSATPENFRTASVARCGGVLVAGRQRAPRSRRLRLIAPSCAAACSSSGLQTEMAEPVRSVFAFSQPVQSGLLIVGTLCYCLGGLLCLWGAWRHRRVASEATSGFMHLRNIVEKSPILRKPKAARRRYTTITGVILTPVILGGCC